MSHRFGTIGVVMVVVLALAGCGGSVAGAAPDDAGAGSNDEAQESLEEAGVDLDLDELEETVTGFSTGDDGGVVTIDGIAYEVESSVGFDFDGDGTDDPSASVSVSVGQTELFGSGPEDQPRYYAESNVYDQGLADTLDGGRMMGSGEMTDRNDYENYDKSYPVTFEASCS
jgi:hypothetical protein